MLWENEVLVWKQLQTRAHRTIATMILSPLALLLGAASAAVVAPRDPAITAAPELRKRVDISTFAWYSDYEFGGTVECEALIKQLCIVRNLLTQTRGLPDL